METNLVARAQALFADGDYQGSNAVMLELLAQTAPDPYHQFQIGRNFLYLGDLGRARHWLVQALSSPPTPWLFYELAILEEKCEAPIEAGSAILRFLESDTDHRLRKPHRAAILRIAHWVFQRQRSLALEIYKRAEAIGSEDYLGSLRIIEAALDDSEIAEAKDRFKTLRSRHPLDVWGFLALSRIHQRESAPAEARDAVLQAVQARSDDEYVLNVCCNRLIDLKFFDDAAAILERLEAAGAKSDSLAGLRLRLATRRHDVAGVDELLRDGEALASVEKWVLAEALFEFAVPGEADPRQRTRRCGGGSEPHRAGFRRDAAGSACADALLCAAPDVGRGG